MAHELLATFYVQCPEYPNTDIRDKITVEVHSYDGNNWKNDSVMAGSYSMPSSAVKFYLEVDYGVNDPVNQSYRYKIDVFRREAEISGVYGSTKYFPLFKAGAHEFKMMVKFDGLLVLTRTLCITVQPDLRVYRKESDGTEVALVTTTTTQKYDSTDNTADYTVTVSNVNPIDDINIDTPKYKDTGFIKSNLPLDVYCENFSLEKTTGTWLRLAEKIRMTRRVNNAEHTWSPTTQWNGTTPVNIPVIQTDTANNKEYVNFITDSVLTASVYYTGAELGLEKLPLVLPLHVQSNLELYGQSVRYTGTGINTTPTTPINVPLKVILKTPHTIEIYPKVLTLDEDNNYTSFITVEANDDTVWSLATEQLQDANKLTFSQTSGSGRAAVVVNKTLYELTEILNPLNSKQLQRLTQFPRMASQKYIWKSTMQQQMR